MQVIAGKRSDTKENVTISLRDGIVESIAVEEPVEQEGQCWLTPGFVDLQINGIGGHEFVDSELSEEIISKMCLEIVSTGTTRFLPTVTTESYDRLATSLANLSRAIERNSSLKDCVLGYHVEGPYISPEDGPRGAHPKAHCRPPNWSEFERLQEAANGQIRLLTLSPEYDNASTFIEQAVRSGVTIAIGHTNANSAQIDAAVSAGATLSTHLGNGAHAQIQRHPNYIWDQLADDRLAASIIADGHHLPESVLRSFFRVKGTDRTILVSDMTGMAGMSPGVYQSPSLGNVEVLDSGKLVVAGQRQYLAGAARPLWDCITHFSTAAPSRIEDTIRLATQNALSAIGLDDPWLQVGTSLDCVVIQETMDGTSSRYQIREVFWRGETVDLSPLIA